MPKSPKLSKKSVIVERKLRRNLAAIALTALVIKIFIFLEFRVLIGIKPVAEI